MQDALALEQQGLGLAEVDGRRGHQAEAGVVVLVVVPVEELLSPDSSVEQAAEAFGESRMVLHGLELGFGEGVVVGRTRPGQAWPYAQVAEEQRQGFGGHRPAAVGVQAQLARGDALLQVPQHFAVPSGAFADQLLGQGGALALGDQPTDDPVVCPAGNRRASGEAAEQIQQHVQTEADPFRRPGQAGDVPGPNLIGCGRQQAGFGIDEIAPLVAALPNFVLFPQNAIHRRHRAQVLAFVQQRGVD